MPQSTVPASTHRKPTAPGLQFPSNATANSKHHGCLRQFVSGCQLLSDSTVCRANWKAIFDQQGVGFVPVHSHFNQLEHFGQNKTGSERGTSLSEQERLGSVFCLVCFCHLLYSPGIQWLSMKNTVTIATGLISSHSPVAQRVPHDTFKLQSL